MAILYIWRYGVEGRRHGTQLSGRSWCENELQSAGIVADDFGTLRPLFAPTFIRSHHVPLGLWSLVGRRRTTLPSWGSR
jgi:hypothetical protein